MKLMSIHKSILAVTVSLGVLFSAISQVYAQEITAEHLIAAKDAIKASRSTRRLDNILPQMAENAKTELIRNLPDKEVEITTIVDEVAIELAPRRGDLESEVAQIFARVFTEEELKVMTEFFNTEAGKKFLEQSPLVVREIDRASRVWGSGVQRDLGEKVQAKLKEAGLQ